MNSVPTYFSDFFGVEPDVVDRYGAFDISLVTDLPLFIDPFLLFNSPKAEYQHLHAAIVRYLLFLRDKAAAGPVAPGLLDSWFRFPEIRQTWLGFSVVGNRGSGLGSDFAAALHDSLHGVFGNLGDEHVTRDSHLEKLCLIREGVGRDNISDFTTNLIKGFLLEYTQTFAREHLRAEHRLVIGVPKVRFNYETETWETARFELPWQGDDYVLLTPKDILTRIDTWINKTDLFEGFEQLPPAIPNAQLRAQVNNYFESVLVRRRGRRPTRKARLRAAAETIRQFPELIDVYIRFKEDHGDDAVSVSTERVRLSQRLYLEQFRALQTTLAHETGFYQIAGNTYVEAHQRIAFLKDIIENKGGHKFFYVGNQPIQREEDVHLLYRLTWIGTPSDVSREVNDGRGPADFKVSRGSRDKTIVEFKLAKNTHLRRNLEKQAEIYKRASDAGHGIKVIVYFTAEELERVQMILADLGIVGSPDIVLIDARADNKPSGSKA